MLKDMTHKNVNRKSQVILVREIWKKISGKNPVLLFSTAQIEEIIHTIDIYPVPFAPDYLIGVCLWRKIILPVIDISRRYSQHIPVMSDIEYFYMVVKTVGLIDGKQQLAQGVLKISKRIITTKIPDSCSIATISSGDIDNSIIKGVFEYHDDVLIIPDLASVFKLI